jgi:MFS family permease
MITRGLPRTFWYLWTGALVNRLGGFVFAFLALYLTKERGYSVEAAGLVVTLYGAGSVCAGPVGGLLADHVGRRATLLLSTGLASVAMLQLGFARTPTHIALSTLILGFVTDLYRPAVQATIADVVPPADRPRAYGYLYWAVNLGFAGAAVIAGLVASRSFTALFVADAATTLAFGAIVFLRVPETHPEPGARRRTGEGLRAPLRDRAFLAFIFAQLLVALIFQQGFVALPVDMRAHGVSPRGFGLLISLNGILIVLLQPPFLRFVGLWPRERVLAVGALLVGTGFGLTALAGGPLLYAGSIAIWTAGEIFFSSVAPAVVADRAPPHLRGSYQGMYQLSWSLSTLAAPTLGALVLGRLGSAALWGGCFGVGIVAALAHLALAPLHRRAAVEAQFRSTSGA